MKKKLDDLKTFVVFLLLGPVTILISIIYFVIFIRMFNFSIAFFMFMIILIALLIIRYFFLGYYFMKRRKSKSKTRIK